MRRLQSRKPSAYAAPTRSISDVKRDALRSKVAATLRVGLHQRRGHRVDELRVLDRVEPHVRVVPPIPSSVEQLHRGTVTLVGRILDGGLEPVPHHEHDVRVLDRIDLVGDQLQIVRLRPCRREVLHLDAAPTDRLDRGRHRVERRDDLDRPAGGAAVTVARRTPRRAPPSPTAKASHRRTTISSSGAPEVGSASENQSHYYHSPASTYDRGRRLGEDAHRGGDRGRRHLLRVRVGPGPRPGGACTSTRESSSPSSVRTGRGSPRSCASSSACSRRTPAPCSSSGRRRAG